MQGSILSRPCGHSCIEWAFWHYPKRLPQPSFHPQLMQNIRSVPAHENTTLMGCNMILELLGALCTERTSHTKVCLRVKGHYTRSKKDLALSMAKIRLYCLASKPFPFSIFQYICSHKEYLKLSRARKQFHCPGKIRKKRLRNKNHRVKNIKILI